MNRPTQDGFVLYRGDGMKLFIEQFKDPHIWISAIVVLGAIVFSYYAGS